MMFYLYQDKATSVLHYRDGIFMHKDRTLYYLAMTQIPHTQNMLRVIGLQHPRMKRMSVDMVDVYYKLNHRRI